MLRPGAILGSAMGEDEFLCTRLMGLHQQKEMNARREKKEGWGNTEKWEQKKVGE